MSESVEETMKGKRLGIFGLRSGLLIAGMVDSEADVNNGAWIEVFFPAMIQVLSTSFNLEEESSSEVTMLADACTFSEKKLMVLSPEGIDYTVPPSEEFANNSYRKFILKLSEKTPSKLKSEEPSSNVKAFKRKETPSLKGILD